MSNPFMADNLPNIVWFSTHHVTFIKSWLVQKQIALGKDSSNTLIVDSLLKTIWFSIHHHLTNEVLAIPGQTTTGVNTPRSDEDRLNLMELMVFLLQKGVEIYHLDLDHPSKVLSMQEDDSEVQEVVKVVTTAKLITEVITATTSQVSSASATISTAKPSIPAAALTVVDAYTRRIKGVIIRDPEKELSFKTPAETPKLKDKGKEEEDQEVLKTINETPAQKLAKRRKLNEEAQEVEDLKKHLEVVNDEDDDVFTEATPLARKVPVVDYQIVLINNKPRFKIIKADETHQLYISFITLLKNFDREDLEDLWGIVKERFYTSKPNNFSDEYLLTTLKIMFEKPDGQD
nr:hypothetical protein [Tanacetum cinerariifolium]